MKVSSWLKQSGIIETNIKDTIESTIKELLVNCPLKVSKESMHRSLVAVVKKDKRYSEKSTAHEKIFNWLKEEREKSAATFKKTRASVSGTTNDKQDRSARSSSPPPVEQIFSFSSEQQGAIVEYFYTSVEKELYKFLVENENIIPAKTVEAFAARQNPPISSDFRNADVLAMLNFIIEQINVFLKQPIFHGQYKTNPGKIFKDFKENVRHKMAHGICIDQKGRWSDLALQNVAHLSCEIIACLGK